MELTFKRDTAIRKQYFTPESFAHPAKMDCQLLMWIVEQYTKAGEVILDPMAGMGTTMWACTMGRNVVLVELEQKFVDMETANWEKVRMMPQLGHTMGACQILQGDARQLEGLLVDKCVFSPPFGRDKGGEKGMLVNDPKRRDQATLYRTYSSEDNIDNLPYGSIDSVITSPPYTERMDGGTQLQKGFVPYSGEPDGWFTTRPQDNIGNLRYGNIDHITSPPYEGSLESGSRHTAGGIPARDKKLGGTGLYASENTENIGNLKSDSYLSAMLQVYQQCHKVLKPQGLIILVTKNFIRNRQIVRLDTDTIKLCEQAGFTFLERHYRKLPAQSFWRTIYYKKYPDVEKLEHEDILVFKTA